METTGTTGDLTKLAANRLKDSVVRRAVVAWRWIAAHRRPVAGGLVGLAVAVTALGWPRDTARADDDRVSSLVRARANDRLGARASTALEHARAAQALGEYVEMLEALETAARADPSITKDPEFFPLALQSLNASRVGRSQALMQLTDRRNAEPLLQAATSDYSYRVRHGAADALKLLGVAVADPVPMYLLDVWQHERCDARRGAAKALLAVAPTDARTLPGIEAAAQRSNDDGCLTALARARR